MSGRRLQARALISIVVERALRRSARSYSQAGEDMIARFALRELGILVPTYLDIGAHHPTWLSNTYYFYRHGCRGVCVEADPRLHRRIARRRPRDLCLNIAVGTEEGTATLHVMRASTLSTLSSASMSEYAALGRAHRRDVQVPMLTPATLLERHCPTVPNLVSLDIEGLDLDVLRAWDFDRWRPEVFIAETLTLANSRKLARKRAEIIDHMTSVGYFVYGDTRVNTIFVDREAWERGSGTPPVNAFADRIRARLRPPGSAQRAAVS